MLPTRRPPPDPIRPYVGERDRGIRVAFVHAIHETDRKTALDGDSMQQTHEGDMPAAESPRPSVASMNVMQSRRARASPSPPVTRTRKTAVNGQRHFLLGGPRLR